MALSGMLPWGSLPSWMYHAQIPPPAMKFDPTVPGITWVDLVFPFFLFALGAAIPLSLGPKLQTQSPAQNAIDILRRGALLAAFAFASQHFRPLSYNPTPTDQTWWLALLFFAATVLAFARFPQTSKPHPAKSQPAKPEDQTTTNTPYNPKPSPIPLLLNALGALTLLTAPFWIPGPEKPYFDTARVDIILLVLANVAVSGAFLWWLTRDKPNLRLAAMLIVAALFLARTQPGPAKDIWDSTPLPWLLKWEFHKYLLIVLPGTFCGELALRHAAHPPHPEKHTPAAGWFLAIVGIALSSLACYGLHSRDLWLTLAVGALLCAGALAVIHRACHMSPHQFQIAAWGTVLFVAGVLLDPLDGGIKKDSANLSYFLTTSGLAFYMVLAWGEITKNPLGQKSWRWLLAVGANPLLGYVAITNFVPAFIRLTGIHPWVGAQGWSPWTLAAYATFQTALVALVCVLASRNRFYLRA